MMSRGFLLAVLIIFTYLSSTVHTATQKIITQCQNFNGDSDVEYVISPSSTLTVSASACIGIINCNNCLLDAAGFTLNCPSGKAGVLVFSSNNVTIRNMNFDGDGLGLVSQKTNITNVQASSFSNVRTGVTIYETNTMVVESCLFNNTQKGIETSNPASSGLTVRNNTFLKTTSSGADITAVSTLLVTGNRFESTQGNALSLSGNTDSTITNNYILNSQSSQIILVSVDFMLGALVVSNNIVDGGVNGISFQVRLRSTTTSFIMENNIIQNVVAANTAQGTFDGFGLECFSYTNNVIVRNNTIQNIQFGCGIGGSLARAFLVSNCAGQVDSNIVRNFNTVGTSPCNSPYPYLGFQIDALVGGQISMTNDVVTDMHSDISYGPVTVEDQVLITGIHISGTVTVTNFVANQFTIAGLTPCGDCVYSQGYSAVGILISSPGAASDVTINNGTFTKLYGGNGGDKTTPSQATLTNPGLTSAGGNAFGVVAENGSLTVRVSNSVFDTIVGGNGGSFFGSSATTCAGGVALVAYSYCTNCITPASIPGTNIKTGTACAATNTPAPTPAATPSPTPKPTPTPTSSPLPYTCGNGIPEPGEQCDDGGACCDKVTCQFLAAGSSCRPWGGACDIQEFCLGNSSQCPPDKTQPADFVCNPAKAGNDCDYSISCGTSTTVCPKKQSPLPTKDSCGVCGGDGSACTTKGVCGDNFCNADIGETCSSCTLDCGYCASTCVDSDCNGHGSCSSGACVCTGGWSGPKCNKAPESSDASPSNGGPGANITAPSAPTVQFSIAFHSIREVKPSGEKVIEYPLNVTNVNSVVTVSNGSRTWNYTLTFENGADVLFTFLEVDKETSMTFVGQTFALLPNVLKNTIAVYNWPFATIRNTLQITFAVSAPTAACQTLSSLNVDSSSTWVQYNVEGVMLYAKFLANASLDDSPKPMNLTLDTKQKEVVLTLPHFWSSGIIDPDFSVVLDYGASNVGTCGLEIKDNKSNGVSKTLLIATIVPIVVAFIIVAILGFLYFRHRRLTTVRRRSAAMGEKEMKSIQKEEKTRPLVHSASPLDTKSPDSKGVTTSPMFKSNEKENPFYKANNNV